MIRSILQVLQVQLDCIRMPKKFSPPLIMPGRRTGSGEFTHTLHRQARRHATRHFIIIEDIDRQWEADLVDMQEFALAVH